MRKHACEKYDVTRGGDGPQAESGYLTVSMGWVSSVISQAICSFENSAFCKRRVSQLETEIVAITIAHGISGEIQKIGMAKLTRAIQARLAKAPNKNAARREVEWEVDWKDNGYKHKACTMSAKGKATTRSTK